MRVLKVRMEIIAPTEVELEVELFTKEAVRDFRVAPVALTPDRPILAGLVAIVDFAL